MKSILYKRIKFCFGLLTVVSPLFVTVLVKAPGPDSSKKYQFFVEPYIMFTSMSGTTGIGNLPNTFVCVPASKVFSYLKIGGMLYGEVHNDQLAFTSDL